MGLPAGWTEHLDPTSGKQFYHNVTSGETSWDRPAGAANDGTISLPDGWTEHIDAASGNVFYSRAATGETSWDRPTNGSIDAGAGAGQEAEALPQGWTEHVDSSSGKAFYYKESTGETCWERPKLKSNTLQDLPDGWAAHVDPESGRTFYHNVALGTTSWDKPQKAPATWATEQAHNLGQIFNADTLQPKVRVLEKISWTSVSKTVQALNQGVLVVELGVCVAFSRSQDSYWLLWRADKVDEASKVITAWENKVTSALPDGWAEHVDSSSGRPFYHKAATGETSWDRPQQTQKEQLKIHTQAEQLEADNYKNDLDQEHIEYRDQNVRRSLRSQMLKKKSVW